MWKSRCGGEYQLQQLFDVAEPLRQPRLTPPDQRGLASGVWSSGLSAAAVAQFHDQVDRHSHDHNNGGAGHKGAVVSAMVRSGVTAAAHQRHVRRRGRAPGLKHFAAYAAVGAGTSAATKWLNGRIDLTAPKIS